jgi:hypothetical protein
VSVNVQALFDDVMRQKPSDRLRLAAMLLDTDPTKAEMALGIAKSACHEIEMPILDRKLEASRKRLEASHVSNRVKTDG